MGSDKKWDHREAPEFDEIGWGEGSVEYVGLHQKNEAGQSSASLAKNTRLLHLHLLLRRFLNGLNDGRIRTALSLFNWNKLSRLGVTPDLNGHRFLGHFCPLGSRYFYIATYLSDMVAVTTP